MNQSGVDMHNKIALLVTVALVNQKIYIEQLDDHLQSKWGWHDKYMVHISPCCTSTVALIHRRKMFGTSHNGCINMFRPTTFNNVTTF